MNSKIAALILGALAAMSSANPIVPVAEARDSAIANSTAPGEFHKLITRPKSQAVTHVFVCTDSNFKGRCENLESTKQGCYSDINAGCSGASLGGIVKPGIFDLANYGFNDRASSYKCN
ncbi:MAG: hypothetical protein LQ337_000800 [Flavoplaca oasis]|nr:MAG: hypothetical protein LQ337_000800 [Flavoplaca oasis]